MLPLLVSVIYIKTGISLINIKSSELVACCCTRTVIQRSQLLYVMKILKGGTSLPNSDFKGSGFESLTGGIND